MGEVVKFERWIPHVGQGRRIHLYLPNGYWNSAERYPVVYFFDGHNLFFDSDATYGHSLRLKDFLDGWHKPLIVVGIECANNDRQRFSEYCPYRVQSWTPGAAARGCRALDPLPGEACAGEGHAHLHLCATGRPALRGQLEAPGSRPHEVPVGINTPRPHTRLPNLDSLIPVPSL